MQSTQCIQCIECICYCSESMKYYKRIITVSIFKLIFKTPICWVNRISFRVFAIYHQYLQGNLYLYHSRTTCPRRLYLLQSNLYLKKYFYSCNYRSQYHSSTFIASHVLAYVMSDWLFRKY